MESDLAGFGVAPASGGLTDIQAEILDYVARGWDRQKIALQMGVPASRIGDMLEDALAALSGRLPAHRPPRGGKTLSYWS